MFREDGNVLHFTAPKGALFTPDFYAFADVSCRARFFTPPTREIDPRWLTLEFPRLFSTVHAAVSANTFAIYGTGHVKELTELVPGILNQLGPDSLASLRKLAESYQAIQQGQQRQAPGGEEEDDDDVPDLVENFDVEADAKANLD